jgi:acyl carrier protein
MTDVDVKETIRQFILSKYLPGESPANLRDDTPLRTSGVLDSLATLGVVNFIEQTFGIELLAHETGVDSFDRIEDIAALVARKRGHAGGGERTAG